MRSTKNVNVEADIDDLFRLSLADFTNARNSLAARLKKEGHRDDADRVKLLAKPSISAWAVNQLYWNYREEFEDLIAIGKRFRQGQTSRQPAKISDMRESLDARREALAQLSDLATGLLRHAGHSPTLDTLRRITTTLEALSTYALLPDGPTPGRLTQDVDPPSFESLASLITGSGQGREPARLAPSPKAGATRTTSAQKSKTAREIRKLQEAHRQKIAVAKTSLQDAKQSLSDARAKAQSLETTHKNAVAEAKEAERYKRDAERQLEKATAAAKEAAQHAQSMAAEMSDATKSLQEAKHRVEQATKELEALLRESPTA